MKVPTKAQGRVFLTISFALLLAGCASVERTTDVSPIDSEIFRGKWFDYYNRGLRRILDGEYEAAADDLRTAIHLRPEDSHRARTYGVRFQSYYPHRELGILALRGGEVDTALRELERSFREAPSPKGIYHLNEVRRRHILQSGLDQAPPEIQLDPIPALTSQRKLQLRGHVTDDIYIDLIRVNDQRLYFELAEPEITFSPEVELKPGPNQVRITAGDLSGKTAESVIEVFLDVEAPSLGLDAVELVEEEGGREVLLQGTVYDDSGIGLCRIGDMDIPSDGPEVLIDRRIPLGPDDTSVPFVLRDTINNENRGEILLEGPGGGWRTGALDSPRRLRVASSNEELVFRLSRSLVSAFGPMIRFGVPDNQHDVYREHFYIDGTVFDEKGISSVQLNGIDLGVPRAREIRFRKFVDLAEGTNPFCIHAENSEGVPSEKTVELIYRLTSGRQREERLRLACYPFVMKGTMADTLPDSALNQLEKEIDGAGRFQVQEREYMDEIMLERWIAESNLADRQLRARAGALQEAHLLLFGEMIESPPGVNIFLHVIDVANINEPAGRFEVYHPGTDAEGIAWPIEGLYIKLEDAYPLVEGKIVHVERERAMTTLSRRHRVRPGRRLFVIREGEEIVEDGISYGAPEVTVGELQVKSVDEKKSMAERIKGEEIRKGDYVITE